jgi:hypothetical protein
MTILRASVPIESDEEILEKLQILPEQEDFRILLGKRDRRYALSIFSNFITNQIKIYEYIMKMDKT